MEGPSTEGSPPVSLLAGLNCRGNTHLIIGTNPLAASRCTQSLNADARPIIVAPADVEVHYSLQKRIDDGEVKWLQKAFEDSDLFTLGREEVSHVVDSVFVTSGPHDPQSQRISEVCKRNRIPVNVVDAPQLCTFTLLSTHTDGPLQIGITTNGRGCKLASRIRREIAASLPANLGAACARLGEVRRRVQQESALAGGDLEEDGGQGANFNRLVLEGAQDEAKTRRMRWLSQVCEYWPLRRLASIGDDDVEAIFKSYPGTPEKGTINNSLTSGPNPNPNSLPSKQGKIILAGSGPGHPDLLTQATHKAIQAADLVLADKLVPAGVLDLIPRRTRVHIARKFPGNADLAQQELLDMALAGYRQGQTVLRLKQGDPYVYGRGGEEVQFFRDQGISTQSVIVLPGITSALSAPLFAAIPATQRDVSDQVLICTGTGKKGKAPTPPEFVATRTVVFLMALHRIVGLVRELTTHVEDETQEESVAVEEGEKKTKSQRTLWPLSTPCAVIERASCPDQRVIRTTLRHVAEAIETEGSRPPGLLVVGKSCDVLYQQERGRAWAVEEGFRGLEVDDLAVDELAKLAA
ncbi:unnamed protein product [Clonostachys byssicola]|uniref:Precorrin-2 dehydrogenase n=1 Tax=Clonostachys byssicola TaxID=160290 RepID=A0A9N9US39_9HYPO|nr:unnamed protein product [Clonostachys byssicola]